MREQNFRCTRANARQYIAAISQGKPRETNVERTREIAREYMRERKER